MIINCSDIHFDPTLNKSRQPFSLDSCQGLADSIAQYGQDIAVHVTEGGPDGKLYTLRVGFRRYTAIHYILKQDTIKVEVVKYASEDEAAMANLRENLEREDLTYFEQCQALRDIFPAEAGINTIAQRVTRSRHWVRCRWSVWELEPEILLGVETGDLTPSDIALMLGKSREEQIATAETIRLGKAKGESRDTIATKLGRKATRPNKQQIGQMLTLMESNDRQEAKFALLWANGTIDNDEFLNYTKCKETETG